MMKVLLCRTHDDITVLYESFVMKRKLIKEAVRRNIEEFYSKERVKSSNVSIERNFVLRKQSWCLTLMENVLIPVRIFLIDVFYLVEERTNYRRKNCCS